RGCARTSCSACWPIICNGTCAEASRRCCSTSPIRLRATRSRPRRWRKPSPHRRRNTRPPANAPTRQMANRSRCTASTRCLAISPRSPVMSSASAAITSPPSSPPLPAHSTAPSICSALLPPRRQTDTTAAQLYQWLALKRGQSSAEIAGSRKMQIAQVAPLYESCPPQLYGGTERVVSYLTEELVRQGHEVTLFASGDSQTTATLRASCERALRLDPQCRDPLAHHLVMLHRVACRADDFDIIHFHTDYLHFPLFAECWAQTLTTLHGRLDLPDLAPITREFAAMPLVSISNAQRTHLPWANSYGTVYHGLPTRLYAPGCGDGGYLAFIGRICPEKRPD